MREILFRGKNLDNGEWVEGYLEYYYSNDGCRRLSCYISQWGRCMHKVNPATIGQFTGLLDKHGKRIFEEDVLKDDWGKVYEVFFNARNCSFMVKLKHATNEWETGNYRLGEAWSDTIRVIGTIHDNPELLEEGE